MRRLLVFLIAAGFASACLAQEKASSDSPVKAPDYSKEAYVVEQWKTTYRFESDGTGSREVYARIRVQSEAGVQQLGQVVLGYSSANERVDIRFVKVTKADKTVVTAPTDAVQDLTAPVTKEAPMYTDYRQKHITVPGLRPGELLEYDFVTVIHTPLAQGHFWVEHEFLQNDIVLDEQLEVNIPKERAVTLKTKAGNDPVITEEGGRKIYRWAVSHKERDDDDSDDSGSKKNKKKKKAKDADQPAVQMTTFTSWEEMGRWYGSLEKDRQNPTDEIRAKAAAITAGKATDLEKVEALYDYVATNFRYVSLSFGLGRYQPHSAADVLHNQYGDCKDKNTLLASLLRAAGFHPSSVLVNAYRKIDPDVPSPAQFNHVISLAPLGTDQIWMDTTTEVAPFRLLSYSIRKKQGLVIPADGTPKLEETPANPPQPGQQLQELTGKVNEFGKLDAHIKFVARGDVELLMRTLFRRVPNTRWPQMVRSIGSRVGLDGEVTNLRVSDPAATKEPLEFEWDLAVNNFFDWSKKKSELGLPLSEIELMGVDEDNLDPDEPIQLGSPMEYIYRIKLEFPPKYTVRAPLAFSMKRDYGQYQATYKADGNIFTAERKMVLAVRELPSSRSGDYLAFRRAVSTDTVQRFSLDGTAAGTPKVAADLKGDDLSDAANSALDRQNYELAVDLYKRVLDEDSKNKTAWISLGRAYMGLQQTDKAADAFKKQAELNPYDEYAYNSLGWAYSTDRKYAEAEAAYLKAIEINPLSQYGHSALGGVYSDSKQYDKAAAELEKAASLKSDDAFLQVRLGDAYLNQGQDEKALQAFDRAVEISATPEVWNNIAYQLSLKGSHLDRAQRYAESAVTAVAAGLRNSSLGQLTPRDLALVNALAAHWDTLGWVYFAKGDLDNAEKYVGASWNVSQHSEVGDHLGQIYEKKGKKQEALRTYAMAVAALRPSEDTKKHLSSLLGDPKKFDTTVDKFRGDAEKTRTFILTNEGKKEGTAEFFVMLIGGPSATSVEGVKFVSGDEGLKDYVDPLRRLKYEMLFPDTTPTKVLRRGVLTCAASSNCKFVLMLPQDVRGVD